MQNDSTPKRQLTHQILLFLGFLLSGSAIFVFGNNWTSLFPTNRSALYKWGLACLFLVLALVLRERERFQVYWKVALALFVAASANALMWSLGDWLADLLPPPVRDQITEPEQPPVRIITADDEKSGSADDEPDDK